MIDLYTFLIIKPSLLDILINKLGTNLLIGSESYTMTLLIANCVAYLVIYLVFKIAMYLYRVLLTREFRRY